METKAKTEIGDTGVYTVVIPTKTKEVQELDENNQPLFDEDNEPIMKKEIVKTTSCKIKPDFNVLKRAYSKMIIISKGGKTEMNLIGAGEHVLMYSNWIEGDENIKTDPQLKMSASLALAEVVSSFEVAELKKN